MKKLIPKKKAGSLYKLVVEYQHGDADFKTNETYTAKNEEALIELYDTCLRLMDAMRKAYEPYEHSITEYLEQDDKDARNMLQDMPYDQKYEGSGYRAVIVGLKLFVNGVEQDIVDV